MALTEPKTERPALDGSVVDDLNVVSEFLATPVYPFPTGSQGGVYVIAGSAILSLPSAVADHLEKTTGPVTVVISGGIGHSTTYLYDAVAQHPKYKGLLSRIQGLPEAEVIRHILMEYWPSLAKSIQEGRITLLVDDKSTNCGANAVETKRILDHRKIWPKRLHIVQDPTMSRRTMHCFEKVYIEDERATTDGIPDLLPWTFFPKMALSDNGTLEWSVEDPVAGRLGDHELWDHARFISLVLGEIPRMRDDAEGYGPNGKGFITHVDIPLSVEEAWGRLSQRLKGDRA